MPPMGNSTADGMEELLKKAEEELNKATEKVLSTCKENSNKITNNDENSGNKSLID